jgi:2-keto-4-pentenoate hydratase
MDAPQILDAAERLLRAQAELVPIEPLTETYGDFPISDAYLIQKTVIDKRLVEGRRVVGKKIGLTSEPMQKFVGVDEPDYGQILDNMVFEDCSALQTSQMIAPRVEAEIGALLKKDLVGPGVTAFDAARACDAVFPLLEIIDSRVKDWKIRIQDTVADNASGWGVVYGSTLFSPSGIDLSLVGLTVRLNGRPISHGVGAAVLGSPYRSLAWLANKMAEYGTPLRAGESVLLGSLVAAFVIKPGDNVLAMFDRVGHVSAIFE